MTTDKTPEELSIEYAHRSLAGGAAFDGIREVIEVAFLAGYKAAFKALEQEVKPFNGDAYVITGQSLKRLYAPK